MSLAPELVAELDLDLPFTDGWTCSACAPGTVTHPDQPDDHAHEMFVAQIPGTVASALRDAGRWDFRLPPEIDASDWWYRKTFGVRLDDSANPTQCTLCFDGLATLAEVWLNGESILTTDNMFRSYRVDVTSRLRDVNELAIVFRSVSHDLKRKRPRPKWKTNLVDHQQLRWIRTSLQGRIPGWSPPVPAIGPWRGIRLETNAVQLAERHLRTRLDGTTGVLNFEAQVLATSPITRAELRVGEHRCELSVCENDFLAGELRIAEAPLWWPHTHGEPRLLPCELVIETEDESLHFPCGDVGFRNFEVDTTDGGFSVRVNGVPVFCRGACWTVSDIFTLTGTQESLEHDLQLARDAGVNMLRVTGTMTYESDRFYQLCDRLGLFVWQDFSFANMDYPVADEGFQRNIAQEATEQVRRLAAHPSVVVYCGNSEVEQQAAMLGLPREAWRNGWFGEQLPALCAAHHPETVYVPSTPSGSGLPFHPRSGVTHYYGVGAYLRNVEDVRRSDVRFTPECLGFSNLPEDAAIEAITGGARPVPHAPTWKERVPRDSGAGWDFEDVRDHYVRELFGVDPVALRSRDVSRYLQLGRVATGEMMSQAFSEWRSVHSRNSGALVWFYKDLWPAAGWGIVDSTGVPKSAYYALKRVWQPRQLTLTDEGLNGVHLHLSNETDAVCAGTLEVQLLREPNVVVACERSSIHVPARSRQMVSADDVLGRFYDVSYAYRFGPPAHDIVMAAWFGEDGEVISEAYHFLQREPLLPLRHPQIEAFARRVSPREYRVELQSDSFLQNVRLLTPGYLPSDNYFHLPPRRRKTISLRANGQSPELFLAEFEALNLEASLPISVVSANDQCAT